MATSEEPISDAQAQRYLSVTLANVRKGVDQLGQDELWHVAAGSSLSTDDERTNPYQLSHACRSLLGSAIDHLHAIANLVESAGVLHPMAQFTLARGAIETASAATWLLESPSRPERITRRLRLAVKDSMDSYNASEPGDFFGLYEDFRSFVDFFLLQDLVTDDYQGVRFHLPVEDFARPGAPQSLPEYVTYREATLEFSGARQQRMDDWEARAGS